MGFLLAGAARYNRQRLLWCCAVTNSPLIYSAGGDAEAALARRLGLRCVDQWSADLDQQYLFYRQGCLSIGLPPAAREHPVCVDFAEQQRKRHRGKELLLKAIGGRRDSLRVVDATAGLGRDSFLLASYGAEVVLCERQPVVAALLADGLQRGGGEPEVAEIVGRMQLQPVSALALLSQLQADEHEQRPDVVYLDPMFPDSGKSALVKKEMRLFHSLVGKDEDADALLAAALVAARHRVVVKRPPKAPVIAGPALAPLGKLAEPQFSVAGKAVRFDIYPLKAFAKA